MEVLASAATSLVNASTESLNSDSGFSLQEEKNRQLYIILAIIISVFSACAFVLIFYMIFFPSYSEGEGRGGSTRTIPLIKETPATEVKPTEEPPA